MKKFFNKVQNKANELAIRAKSTLDNALTTKLSPKRNAI